MDSDNFAVLYCPEDNEYRVYCDICDNLCIEPFYKNHPKSQTHTNNTRKRQQISMQFKCDFFDIYMQNVSRNIYLNSFNYRQCLHKKYIIIEPNFFEVDKILGDFVEKDKKKFDLYLVNCEFK